MTHRARFISLTMLAGLCAAVGACGSGSNDATPTGSTAADGVHITVAVAPGNSVPLGDPQFPFAASFTVQVFETSGVGVEIIEIVVQLDSPVVYSQQQIQLAAGSTRVPPRGSLVIPLAIGLTTNGITAQLLVKAVDDDGNSFEALARLLIIPAQGP